jgi:predicted TIM-barrel fold metal-dependent hydrolase
VAELPFVDTHFHLHDLKHPDLRYSWLEWDAVHGYLGNIDAIKPIHYWIEDYIAEIRFANVPKAIHVQAALGIKDPVKETEWVQAFADKTGYPHGIIAECHLQDADAAQVLERQVAYPNVRGIRDFGRGDYLVDPAWQAGFKLLSRHNLVYCLDTRHEFFPQVKSLAHKVPETSICVDHAGFPRERSHEYFKAWQAGIKELGKSENVWMKVSGLGMGDHLWTVDSIRPYVMSSIEAFGTDRLVFGTNWPVDRMYSSYPDVINAYAEIIRGFSKDEQRAMFSGNAERLFRI